mgnify:CR=1 FL=1
MAYYPALSEDIYFGVAKFPQGSLVKIRNTSTQREFKSTPATVDLLSLCSGTRSVADIIHFLSQQSGEPVESLTLEVERILEKLQVRGIISLNETPHAGPCVKRIKVKYPLQFAQVEITNRCNLSCIHCFNDSGDPHPHELTTAEILSTIDVISLMGADSIVITGGEPLMHPDLFEIVEHARKAPMTVSIFTNGTLMTEEHVRKFRALNVRGFNISIDSVDENIHDTFRGQKGALRKTLKAVQLLREAGFQIKISVSLCQNNKNRVVEILQYFKENSLTSFGFMPVTSSGRGIEGLAISPEECYYIWVELLTYLKEEFPEALTAIRGDMAETCSIARDLIGIKSDGTIIPCPGCSRSLGVGNVRNVNLEEFWDRNATLEALRQITVKEDEKCKECVYLTFCVGCIASAHTTSGELKRYYPYLCASRRAYDEVIGLTK